MSSSSTFSSLSPEIPVSFARYGLELGGDMARFVSQRIVVLKLDILFLPNLWSMTNIMRSDIFCSRRVAATVCLCRLK